MKKINWEKRKFVRQPVVYKCEASSYGKRFQFFHFKIDNIRSELYVFKYINSRAQLFCVCTKRVVIDEIGSQSKGNFEKSHRK